MERTAFYSLVMALMAVIVFLTEMPVYLSAVFGLIVGYAAAFWYESRHL
jgi:hypothetical protein